MDRISLKAVIIGSLVSFGLMVLLIILLGMLYGVMHAGEGTPEEISAAFANSWLSWLALSAVIVAGYLAARIAGQREVLHGGLSSSLNVLWGLFCILVLGQTGAAAVAIVLLNPLLGMLGGYIHLLSLRDWS